MEIKIDVPKAKIQLKFTLRYIDHLCYRRLVNYIGDNKHQNTSNQESQTDEYKKFCDRQYRHH